VTALCPGFFRTNLNKTMKTSDPSMLKFVDKVFEKSELDASEVADRAYKSLMKGEMICNPHPIGRKAVFIKRWLGGLFRWKVKQASFDLRRREEALQKQK
jgi:short-subunit dehydrogenase